jgi:hypothetical protein
MDVGYFVDHPRVMFTRALANRSVRVFRVVQAPLRPRLQAVLRFAQGSYEPLRQCFGRPERYPGEHRAWLTRVLGMYGPDADLLLWVLRAGPRWAFVQPFMREGVAVRETPVIE